MFFLSLELGYSQLSIGDRFTANGIQYEVTNATLNSETVGAVNYVDGSKTVTIPSTVDHIGVTYTVTSIGGSAFSYNDLTSVIISSTVADIGPWAFASNSLTSVAIPEGVINIESNAFADNNMTSITIPSSVTNIGDYAFSENSLRSVISFMEDPPRLGLIVFSSKGAIDLTIPFGERSTYESRGWTGFKSVSEQGNTFTENGVQYEVTSSTPGLETVKVDDYVGASTSVVIPSTVKDGSVTYTVTSIGGNAFLQNSLTSVIIPNSVTSIGGGAFSQNNLTSVIIPNSVKSIEGSAFRSNQLTSVVIPNSVTSVGGSAFSHNNLTSVVLSDSMTSISGSTFRNNQLTSVVIPNSVTSIGELAFRDNELTSVTISNSVTNIEAWAFGYNQLTSVSIPSSVTHIEGWAFYGNRLASVVIPNSVTSIGDLAFSQNELTSVVLSSSLTTIKGSVFSENRLTSVTIPNSVTSIGTWAFYKNQLTSVVIPSSVTNIGGSAFSDNQLTSITIPYGVTGIGGDAFSDNQLTNVLIPSSVTNIGDGVFYENPLTSVRALMRNPPWLGSTVFSHRDSIDLIIPVGKEDVYRAKGWTSFKSIADTSLITAISIFGEDTLDLGESSQYRVEILPTNVADSNVIWSSLTPDIISIDSTGWLETLREGVGVIVASQDIAIDTFTITLDLVITSFSISGLDTVSLGDSSQYAVEVLPARAINDTSITWQSLTPNTLSISSTGLVKPLKGGLGKITATQGAWSDTLSISVQNPVYPFTTFEDPNSRVFLYSTHGRKRTMSGAQWNQFQSNSSRSQLYLVKVYSSEGAFLKSYKAVR
jgi:hypothetical protein